jgi:hypothetical protein
MVKATGDITKRKRAPQTGEPVLVRLQPHAISELDHWISGQPQPMTRPEAVRRLMEHGLACFDLANRRKRR